MDKCIDIRWDKNDAESCKQAVIYMIEDRVPVDHIWAIYQGGCFGNIDVPAILQEYDYDW